MQYEVKVNCRGCGKYLGSVKADTAGGDDVEEQAQRLVLEHRKECRYYGKGIEENAST